MPPLARVLGLLCGAVALAVVLWVGRYSPLATRSQERLRAEEERAWAVQKAQLQQIADDRKDRERRIQKQAEIDQQEREPPKVADKPPFPKVEIDAKEFDFGEIPVDKTVTHRFTIKNVGQGPLIIRRFVSSGKCGNARVPTPPQQIPPGGTASVEITFTPRELTRAFAKSNHVRTNDPSRPEFDIKVCAKVIDPDGGRGPKGARRDQFRRACCGCGASLGR